MSIAVDKINPNLLKIISEIAKKENITETKVLEDIIKKGIEHIENKQPIDEKIERLSNGKIKMLNKSTYNPKKEDLDKMVGAFEAKKPFDSVEEIKKMEKGKNI